MDCDILLGPCVNIVRDPRGGRNFETFSEDPCLTGRLAVAYINGVQSRGVGDLPQALCRQQLRDRTDARQLRDR